MFDNLIESKRKKSGRRIFGVGAVSLVVHTVVIAGAVYATLSAGETDNSRRSSSPCSWTSRSRDSRRWSRRT